MSDTDIRNTCGNERYWHTEHVRQWSILTHGTRAAMSDTDTRNTCSNERYWHTEHVRQWAILTHGTRAAYRKRKITSNIPSSATSCTEFPHILWRPVSTKMKRRRRRKETNRFCHFFLIFFLRGSPLLKMLVLHQLKHICALSIWHCSKVDSYDHVPVPCLPCSLQLLFHTFCVSGKENVHTETGCKTVDIKIPLRHLGCHALRKDKWGFI